jgi:anaerobic selenocysteine-containing dehydrogenase
MKIKCRVTSESTEIVEINSQDAASRGIEDGQKIRLWKSLGEVVLLARVTNAEAPGVIYSPKGTWLKTSTTGQTFNALISADMKTDIMQGACYNDTFVDCEILESANAG